MNVSHPVMGPRATDAMEPSSEAQRGAFGGKGK